MSRIQEIDRFSAKTENDKEYIDGSSFDNPNAEIEGLKNLRTVNGLHVNFIDSKTFKVVETNDIVRKV